MKKSQLLFFGPHIVGCFGHTGGSANWPRIVQIIFFEQFPTQNPNSKVVHLKQLPAHVSEAPFCGPLQNIGGSANRPRIDRFENFSTSTKSDLKGGLFF